MESSGDKFGAKPETTEEPPKIDGLPRVAWQQKVI